jgi:hypothetical protein
MLGNLSVGANVVLSCVRFEVFSVTAMRNAV